MPSPPRPSAFQAAPSRDAALLRATTDLFCEDEAHDRDDLCRYEELAIHFLPKVAADDRRHVAERLADRRDAPLPVLRLLARDEIAVAAPILERSPALTAVEMLGVIAAGSAEHRRRLAGRAGLPPEVATALRLADGDDAGAAGEAEDPARAFLALDRSGRLAAIARTSTRLAAAPQSEPARLARLVDRAYRTAQALTAARTGKRAQMIEALAALAGVPSAVAEALADDASGEPMAVLVRAANLSLPDARTLLLLGHKEAGESVETFLRVSDLVAGMEDGVAETILTGAAAGRGGADAFPGGEPRRPARPAERAEPPPAAVPLRRAAGD